jgi:hypothetical protein
MLIIALYLTAVLNPCWGSALVVYFTLCFYFYIQPDETFLRAFKFLPRAHRTSSR